MDKARVKVSIVISTNLRSPYICRTIEGILLQKFERYKYELIIVINGSIKRNINILNKYLSYSNIKIFYERELGLSHSRNRGIKEAIGNIIVFIDDDAIPGEDWLKHIVDSFDTSDNDIVCVGGKVLPIWEGYRPRWLGRKLENSLSLLDLGNKRMYFKKRYLPIGTNMAFRRDILLRYGGFFEGLGRKGNKLLSNEENLLFRLLLNEGYKIVYDPNIIVYHYISNKRLKKSWFYRRMLYQGISNFLLYKELLNNNRFEKFIFSFSGILCCYLCLLLIFVIFIPTINSKVLVYVKSMFYIILGYSSQFINSF